MRRRLAPLLVAVPLIVVATLEGVSAQEAPKAQYSIKEDEARVGTRIRRNQFNGSDVAINLTYAQLPQHDRDVLHTWWESIPPGDEPPFPLRGLQEIFDPLRKAHNALLDPGDLFVVATVGTDGKTVEVKIFEAPSKKMGEFAAQVLFLTAFKPAICSGAPCRMEFPLRLKFAVTTR